MKHPDPALAVLLALLALLGIPAVGAWYMWGKYGDRPRIELRDFKVEAWKAASLTDEGYSPRMGMLPDLMRRHLRIGTARDAVAELLGEPKSERWSDRHPYPGWSIGKIPAPSDGTGLCIEFDEQDRVKAVHIPYWSGSEELSAARDLATFRKEPSSPRPGPKPIK